ncbi:MarR family transcriptional regulator [bacterium]|nr:MarR family transcriptional regulator [bacterium]
MENSGLYIYSKSLEYACELVARTMKEAIRIAHKQMGFEISHEEYIILETIYFSPGIIQLNIAKQISMQRSYVSKLLSKLEQKGYIRKEEGIKGKKKTTVKSFLTLRGEKTYLEIHNYLQKEILNRVTKEEINEAKAIAKQLFLTAELIKKAGRIKF